MDIDIKQLLKQVQSSHSILRSNKSFMKKAGYIFKNASSQINSLASGLERQSSNKKPRSSLDANRQSKNAQREQCQNTDLNSSQCEGPYNDVSGIHDQKYLGNAMLKKLGYSMSNQLFHIGSYLLEQHKYLKQHGNSIKLTKKKIKRNPVEAQKKREKIKKELQASVKKIQLLEKSVRAVSYSQSRYNSCDNSDQMTIKSRPPPSTAKVKDSQIAISHNQQLNILEVDRRLNTSITSNQDKKHEINIANQTNIRNSRNQSFASCNDYNGNPQSLRFQNKENLNPSQAPLVLNKFNIPQSKNSLFRPSSIARSRASDLERQNLQTKLYIQKQQSIRKEQEYQQSLSDQKIVRCEAKLQSKKVIQRTTSECQQSALIFIEQLKWFIMQNQNLVQQFNQQFPEMIEKFNFKYLNQRREESQNSAYDENSNLNPVVYKSLQETANAIDTQNLCNFENKTGRRNNYMRAKAIFRDQDEHQDLHDQYYPSGDRLMNNLKESPMQQKKIEEKLFGLRDDQNLKWQDSHLNRQLSTSISKKEDLNLKYPIHKDIKNSFEEFKTCKVHHSNEKADISQNQFRSYTAPNKTPTHQRYASQDDDDDEEEVQFNQRSQAMSRKTRTQMYSPKSFILDDQNYGDEVQYVKYQGNNNHSKSFQLNRDGR